MKTFFTAFGGAILGVILGTILLGFIGFAIISGIIANATQPEPHPESIVLTVDLRYGLMDQAATTGPEAIFGNPTGFIDVITRLDAAVSDERVKGIFVRGSEFGIGSSRAEELRTAFLALKAADKFVIAHSQGSYGGGPSSYRAIAAADQIWVQPGSDVVATGISFETLFMKGLFEKLSITADIEALYEFKNAPNTYREDSYTEPHRLAMTRLAESIWDISLVDIAADRGLTIDQARTALESGPLSSEKMVLLKLATEEGWPEDAREAALALAGDESEVLSVFNYIAPETPFQAPVIAIVGGQGPIVTGEAGGNLFSEGKGFASDAVAQAILDAGENEDVLAIVFRVDSPGGSPTASDQIWRAVHRVQTEHKKPVIVSMGSVAASGGYYVSTGADWIVANRTTITGSIGIFGGKFAISEGLARIGVNAESISVGGSFTGAYTSTERFSDEQRVLLREGLTRGYERFLKLVSEGRGLTRDEVHERARGRVWSGEDALQQGLVDQLGGLTDAIAKAREMVDIEADVEIRIIHYPQQSEGFSIGGPMASASAQQLQALGQFTSALNDPRVQALLIEIEASQAVNVQARLPNMTER